MYMFESILDAIPKTRSELVSELELPEVTVCPYDWPERESVRSDSLPSGAECDDCGASSASSLALSRAMTDSDIDYERYHRLKNRSSTDPWWVQLQAALDAFPPDYLDSLNSYQDTSSESTSHSETSEDLREERRRYGEELRLKMERYFADECCVFAPDDPGLLALQEALQDTDLESTV